MKKVIVIMNWKMNPLSVIQALRLAQLTEKESKNAKAEIIVCPPFIFLNEIKKCFKKCKIGAQNSFWQKQGSFTGEISPLMLKKVGCSYVIIGHSERRNFLKENNDEINKKIKGCLDNNLKVIFCIGETEKEKIKNETNEVLIKQIKEGLNRVSLNKISSIIFAYEPVWAIGSGKSCNPEKAENTRVFIDEFLRKKYLIKNPIILYGGSINSKNCFNYLKEAFFNGLLIGGASIQPGEIKKILKKIEKLKTKSVK